MVTFEADVARGLGTMLLRAADVLQRQDAAADGIIMDRHTFAKGLRTAEKRAKLPKLDGSLWHAYRRKWATERKHLRLRTWQEQVAGRM